MPEQNQNLITENTTKSASPLSKVPHWAWIAILVMVFAAIGGSVWYVLRNSSIAYDHYFSDQIRRVNQFQVALELYFQDHQSLPTKEELNSLKSYLGEDAQKIFENGIGYAYSPKDNPASYHVWVDVNATRKLRIMEADADFDSRQENWFGDRVNGSAEECGAASFGDCIYDVTFNFIEPAAMADTSDWQTYRNEEYGFEFKYPGSLEVQESIMDIGTPEWRIGNIDKRGADLWLKFDFEIITANNRSLDGVVKDYFGSPQNISKQEPLHSGAYIEYEGLPGYAYFQLFAEKDKAVKFGASRDYLQSEEFKQILSTFKFTDPASDTSDWRTYRNEEYGFEFKYPNDWIFGSNAQGAFLNSSENAKCELCRLEIIIAFDKNSDSLKAQDYYDGNPGILAFDNPKEDKQIIIDGKTAYTLFPLTGEIPGELVIIPLKEVFIRFDMIYSEANEQFLNQILSTFKFLK